MMSMNTFPRKQYGRIFVEKESDILKVKEIIKQMDEFEYEYLPSNFIGVFNAKEHIFSDGTKRHSIELRYTHKFDSLDLNKFQSRCWMNGIKVFCVMGCEEMIFVENEKSDFD